MKYCRTCGAELVDEAVVCPKCGVAVGEIQEPQKKNSMAIAGFVLSLVALFINLYCIPAVAGLVLSIVGLIQISKGGYKNKNLAIAGIVISVIALAWDILYYAVIGPAIQEALDELLQSVQ